MITEFSGSTPRKNIKQETSNVHKVNGHYARSFPDGLVFFVLFTVFGCFCIPSHVAAFELLGTKWPNAETTFYVDIQFAGRGDLWNSAFEEAMEKWNSATVFNFLIVRGTTVDPCLNPYISTPKNGVDFADTICGDAWGTGTLAVEQNWSSRTNRGITIQSSIVFNSLENWDVYSGVLEKPRYEGIYDFRRVAVHELGHAIGLDHENDVPAIMSTYIGDYEAPQSDDISGVSVLYLGCLPPSTPDSISYPSSDCDGSFSVSWSSSGSATSYTLQMAANSSFTGASTIYSGSSTYYSLALSVGAYYFRVSAGNACGSSGFKNGPAITVFPDADSDGVCDIEDNCPSDYNPGQDDIDGDGIGDACDISSGDPDNDGLNYSEELNQNTNPNDNDTDADGLNDGEDMHPLDPDNDQDGIIDQ